MLHPLARAFLLASLAITATAVGTLENRIALGLALLVALFLMWMAGIADGHEHLRRKRPEAFRGRDRGMDDRWLGRRPRD